MIKKTMNWPILIRRLERGGTFFVESFNIYEPPKFSYLHFPISNPSPYFNSNHIPYNVKLFFNLLY